MCLKRGEPFQMTAIGTIEGRGRDVKVVCGVDGQKERLGRDGSLCFRGICLSNFQASPKTGQRVLQITSG